MNITLSLLQRLWKTATYINIQGNETIDYVNVVGSEIQEPDDVVHLFVATYQLNVEVEGWYIRDFDRRKYFRKITYANPHWIYLIETDVYQSGIGINPEVKIIVVEDTYKAIKQLYEAVLMIAQPKVCAVTGSVGKTTTVALLEDVISTKYKCLRIYSKRITPLLLFLHIINQLQENTQFIVLEFALDSFDHVKKLGELLPPDISILLNIRKMHLEVPGLQDEWDVLEAKSKIITNKSIPILNYDDKYIRTLISEENLTFSLVENKAAVFVADADGENLTIVIRDTKQVINVQLYLLTELTIHQTLVAVAVSSLLNIDLLAMCHAISNFAPKENRIGKYDFRGRILIFEGDVSDGARLLELAKNYYSDTTLLVAHFDFGESKESYLISQLLSAFEEYDRVRILKTTHNLLQLTSFKLPNNTSWVDRPDFFKYIPINGVIVFHHSKYFREVSKNFSLANLEAEYIV